LPYHFYDSAVQLWFAGAGRAQVGSAERARVRRYLEAHRASEGPRSPLFGAAAGKSVVMVMAESLHDFPIDLVLDGQPVAPHLAAFAKESLRFTRFYDQTHLGTTSDGELTSLQSLHPLPAGSVATRYPTNDFHALPSVLAARGYHTLAAVGEPGDEWNMRQVHPRLGFQRSYFQDAFQSPPGFGIGIPDGAFFPQAAALLERQRPPFFAFLLSLSNHTPYRLPEAEQRLRLGTLQGSTLGSYLQTVSYFDRAFGAWVERLRKSGALEQTVVVVFGDHQAFLDDPPGLGALLGLSSWGEREKWEVRKRLPLMIRLPHAEAAGAIDTPGGHLDLAPTVLSLLGVEPSAMVALGRDLLRGPGHQVVFRDGSFLQGDQRVRADAGDRAGLEKAKEQLQISDWILAGNLLPELAPR
jgi:lipoteichoic acid synthase